MLLSAEDVIGTSNDFPCTIADFDEHYTLPPPYNSKLICTPDPNLLESMRSVEYSLNTAVANIIGNSIAVQAQRINVRSLELLIHLSHTYRW